MKLKISHLETPLQEICFLIAIMIAIFTAIGGMIFLLTPFENLQTFFGILGTDFLFKTFRTLGLSTFFISVTVVCVAGALITRCHCLSDLGKNYLFFSWQIFFHICFLILIAAFLTVFQLHFQYLTLPRLDQGAGGIIGQTTGGGLYNNFGLYGALMILTCITLVIGIASQYITLVNILLWVKEQICTFFSQILSTFKIGLKYIPYSKILFTPHLNSTQDQPHTAQSDVLAYTDSQDQDFSQHNEQDHFIDEEEDHQKAQTYPAQETPPTSQEKPPAKKSKAIEKEEEPLSITVKRWVKSYKKPDINLLSSPFKKPKNVENQSKNLEECLKNFQIVGRIVKFHVGATLTMYEFQPNPGVKVSKITKLTDDLALLLGARAIRILTPIPGKMTVGIEVPNKHPYTVSFRQMVKHIQQNSMQLPLALGLDVYNHVMIEDLCDMPHLLVSGTTGSGKSVFINTAINSLLFKRSPKHLRFLMIDPKMIELNPYNGISHLLYPVVTDLNEAKDILCWAEQEMDMRYQKFSDLHSRNISSFNATIKKDSKKTAQRRMGKTFQWEWAELPYIVIVIDELADLMITQGKLVENPITRIAQKARASGIHMILATQRPSADIVTGLIKTNFPTRIAFKVSSSVDSRTILDTTGAEKLLGNGDMLFMKQGGHIDRLQGCFLSERDVKKISDFLRSQ